MKYTRLIAIVVILLISGCSNTEVPVEKVPIIPEKHDMELPSSLVWTYLESSYGIEDDPNLVGGVLGEEPIGLFYKVYLSVNNTGNLPETIQFSNIFLYDNLNKEYAGWRVSDLKVTQNPGVSNMTLLYDIPVNTKLTGIMVKGKEGIQFKTELKAKPIGEIDYEGARWTILEAGPGTGNIKKPQTTNYFHITVKVFNMMSGPNAISSGSVHVVDSQGRTHYPMKETIFGEQLNPGIEKEFTSLYEIPPGAIITKLIFTAVEPGMEPIDMLLK